MTRWNPELHDAILAKLHSHGLTDHEITGRMLDMGYAISQQDVGQARRRIGLKANPAVGQILISEDKRTFKEKPNPLASAKLWLGKRLVEKPNGYYLDGIPASLTTIMRAYNRIRVATGVEQVCLNSTWRV